MLDNAAGDRIEEYSEDAIVTAVLYSARHRAGRYVIKAREKELSELKWQSATMPSSFTRSDH